MESGEKSEGNGRTRVKECHLIRTGHVPEASLLLVLACYQRQDH